MFKTKEFKLIVAGGREYTDYEQLSRTLFAMADVEYCEHEVSIVSGMARGADSLGHHFAKTNNVKVYEFPANWRPNGVYDSGAGHKRNAQMGDFADGLLAFWDGRSPGTKGMIDYMQRLGKPVHVVRYSAFEPASADVGDGENMG